MDYNQLLVIAAILGIVGQLVVIITGFWKGISAILSVHATLQTLVTKVGQKHPPEGLLGDVAEVKAKVETQHDELTKIKERLAERRRTDAGRERNDHVD